MSALAAFALLLSMIPAQAGTPHDVLVSEEADPDTAQLVATTAFPRPRVLALARSNGVVYLGGLFDRVKDNARTYPRNRIAAVDEDTGQVLPAFQLDLNNQVDALAAGDGSVYLGGNFTRADGITRRNLVKVNAATGAVDMDFNARLPGRVQDLELVGDRLFVAGAFGDNLVALDPDTGAKTNYIDLPIDGEVQTAWGKTAVYNFAVDPSGTHLVAVGNFTTVDNQVRHRAFMLDLGGTEATLAPWYYDAFTKNCETSSNRRMAYLQGVDFDPTGEYFVFAATGYISSPGDIGVTVCDAAARFNMDDDDPDEPVWINYTGGDSLFSVVATGAAVYAQGHSRWFNNPEGDDSAGPGAVRRPGIGALDPENGVALDWDPAKPAQVGGQAFLATETGLWIGSDSKGYGGSPHRGLAYAPLQ